MATPQRNGATQWSRKARYAYELLLMVMRWYVLMRTHGRDAGTRKLGQLSPADREEYERLQKCFGSLTERAFEVKIGEVLALVPWMRIPKDRRPMVRAAIMEAGKLYRNGILRDKRVVEDFERAARMLYRQKGKKRTAEGASVGVPNGGGIAPLAK